MPNYHFTYSSPTQMPNDPATLAEVMQAWETWFTELGASVADPGAMLAPGATIAADGAVTSDANGANGYSVVAADDLQDALRKAKGCPVLVGGGSVEVHELVSQ